MQTRREDTPPLPGVVFGHGSNRFKCKRWRNLRLGIACIHVGTRPAAAAA